MAVKDSGFRVRVQRELRERFLDVCRAQDKPAAQVIREFMRHYVSQYEQTNKKEGPGPSRQRGPHYDN